MKEIIYMYPPTSKKGVQYFFAKINFVRQFFLDYASIVKPINKLQNKDQEFEWKPKIKKHLQKLNFPLLLPRSL
jgi:hypothetical protein